MDKLSEHDAGIPREVLELSFKSDIKILRSK